MPEMNNRCGLTLIELIAALSLSAMFMAVLLSIVGKLSTTRDTLKQQKPFQPWKQLLKQQLQRDYIGCRSVVVSPKRISMSGYSSHSGFGSGPSEIEYRIISDETGNWMTRSERSLVNRSPTNADRELVCRTVAGFRSLTTLDTDVAPGVLRLNLLEIERDTKASSTSDTNIADAEPVESFPVVLVRHGAPQ